MTATDRTEITIERVETPSTLAGKYQLSFHLDDRHAVSIHLTQGETLDLWQLIGAYFNLAGMGDAYRKRAYTHDADGAIIAVAAEDSTTEEQQP